MTIIETTVPIFIVIAFGYALKRRAFLSEGFFTALCIACIVAVIAGLRGGRPGTFIQTTFYGNMP